MVRFLSVMIMAVAALSPLANADECGAMPCRANGAPYVIEDNAVIIYPGESFAVTVDVATGKVTHPRPVPEKARRATTALNFKPALEGELGTVALKFGTFESGLLLTVTNNLAGTLKYDATMNVQDSRMVYTSSCPTDAGFSNVEYWRHPIQYLQLSNFRLLPDGADGRCE